MVKSVVLSIWPFAPAALTVGERGYSKDHRPDLMQMIVGVVIDAAGRPVCSEMWPGNTADVSVLVPVIDRLRGRVQRAFKWSSQHLERGGCDGHSEAAFRSVRAGRVAVARSALGGAA